MHRCLVFRLGPHSLGIDIDRVVEVVNPGRPEPVPELPDYIEGVSKVRGEMVPVMDLRKRMGVSPDPSKERTVILRSTMGKVAFIVDDVSGILRFEDDRMKKPPLIFKGLKSRYVLGLYGEGEDMLIVLNEDEILSSDEKIELEHAMRGSGGGK